MARWRKTRHPNVYGSKWPSHIAWEQSIRLHFIGLNRPDAIQMVIPTYSQRIPLAGHKVLELRTNINGPGLVSQQSTSSSHHRTQTIPSLGFSTIDLWRRKRV
ncbi:hypothetical protein VM1G_09943 [Cytospora mali]|uniref:Uncharacterized protein n=1 Tax=Cytospora mali TaxID=578113 RepID=A0A194WCF3_CYTMA|nr:hypothetical protein VM1G_09943 [Valsa mali]